MVWRASATVFPLSTHKVSLWCARAARCTVHIGAILAAEWGPTPAQRCWEQDTVHPVPALHRVRGAARRLRVAPHVPVHRLASNGRIRSRRTGGDNPTESPATHGPFDQCRHNASQKKRSKPRFGWWCVIQPARAAQASHQRTHNAPQKREANRVPGRLAPTSPPAPTARFTTACITPTKKRGEFSPECRRTPRESDPRRTRQSRW